MHKNKLAWWLIPIFSLPGIAAAQTPGAAPPAPDAAIASALSYRSAFEGFRPYTDDAMLRWKEVNDTVGRIGGWRVYARDARQPDDKAPPQDMRKMPEPKTEGSTP